MLQSVNFFLFTMFLSMSFLGGCNSSDTTSPTVQNIVVNNNSWEWGCSEESCQYRSLINDSQSTPASLSSSYGAAASADLPSTLARGTYYVHVQARDAAGNESAIATSADSIVVSVSLISGISSITDLGAKAYALGRNINFEVSFEQTIQVDTSDGTPRLPLRIGNQDRFATYSSGGDSNILSFRYTVVSGDSDTNGVELGSSGVIDLNGGSLSDLTSDLTSDLMTFSPQTFTNVLVDGVVPSITRVIAVSSNPDNSLGKPGDTISLYVEFSENVISFPNLKINFSSGRSGNCTNCGLRNWQSTLLFRYTIINADSGTLQVAGFSSTGIIDRAGNKLGRTLSSPITAGNLTLDTTSPTVQNIVLNNNSWEWGCSEASCRYRSLINDSQSPPASLSSRYGSAATSGSPPVIAGTYYVHVQARDVAGNESAIATSADSIVVIATPPEIVSMTGPVGGTYSIGQNLDFQVIFDRTVQVASGTPQLPLAMGSQNRLATYSSGSDSHTLSFRYTVVSGDSDTDGIALGSSGVMDLSGVVINDFTNPSISFAPQDFATVLVDGANLPAVTITNNPSIEINSDNAAAYSVSGNCEGEYEVRVRVGNIAPSSAPHCDGSGAWTTTLHVGNLDKGSITISASQTNSGTSVIKHATPVSVTVGDFEQVARISSRIAGGAFPGQTIDSKFGHTCVVKSDGRVSCWGTNNKGQLGNNSTSHSNYPVDVRGHSGAANSFLENIVGVTLGNRHSCALSYGGEVLCWGEGYYGQIGNDSVDNRHYPQFVHGINNSGRLGGIVQVSAGYSYSCALGSNGQVSCWGNSAMFQSSGTTHNNAQEYPALVRVSQNGPALDGIVQIAVGVGHSCALNSGGKVLCWGLSREGQLGDGTSGGSYSTLLVYPVAVRGSTGVQGSTLADVVQISTGGTSSCALKSDGTVHCWGKGYTGTGDIISSLYPSAVSVTNVSALTQSTGHSSTYSDLDTKCVLDASGSAKCWGFNRHGQLADSDYENNNITTIRATSNSQRSLRGIVEIKPTLSNTCALMATGKVKCWGFNALIGVGGTGNTPFPVHVPTSSSGPDFAPGARSSQYVCRKNFSKCILSPVSLAPGGGQSNPIISGASSAIDVYGLEDGVTLTLYSDSSCSSAFGGGSVTGVTASNPQTVTLANQVTDRELYLSYKMGGSEEVNSSLCLKSQIIFDRVAPAAPTTIFFGESEPAQDATDELISPLPSRVRVKVSGNAADRIKDYTVQVYFEDSTCGNEDNLVAEGHYDNSATLTLTMTTPPYQWNAYDPRAPNQEFRFYARSLDLVENSSRCVASLPIYLPVPVPSSNFME